MSFPDFYRSLSNSARDEFALKALRSRAYIEKHLLHRKKFPSAATIALLAAATDGRFTYSELLIWFYPKPQEEDYQKHLTNDTTSKDANYHA